MKNIITLYKINDQESNTHHFHKEKNGHSYSLHMTTIYQGLISIIVVSFSNSLWRKPQKSSHPTSHLTDLRRPKTHTRGNPSETLGTMEALAQGLSSSCRLLFFSLLLSNFNISEMGMGCWGWTKKEKEEKAIFSNLLPIFLMRCNVSTITGRHRLVHR